MKDLKEQAEKMYIELFGVPRVPQSEYISQILQLMAMIATNKPTKKAPKCE